MVEFSVPEVKVGNYDSIHFSDTLPILRKLCSKYYMKKDGDSNLKCAALGIESLHKHVLGFDLEGIVYRKKALNC